MVVDCCIVTPDVCTDVVLSVVLAKRRVCEPLSAAVEYCIVQGFYEKGVFLSFDIQGSPTYSTTLLQYGVLSFVEILYVGSLW